MARLLERIPRPSAEKLAIFYGPSPAEKERCASGSAPAATHAATREALPEGLADSMRRAFLHLAPKAAPAPPAPSQPAAPAKDPYAERLTADMIKGNSLMNAGLYRQAVVHFKNMQKKYPCDARVTLKIGLAYKELKEFGAAQEYIRKAIAQGMESHRYTAVLRELQAHSKAYANL